MLFVVATRCMNMGSHCSDGPHVPSGMVMVAWSVCGLLNVGLLWVWPFRARTAAMSAAVACTCAKSGFVLVDGLYRILIPDVFGLRSQAAVRLELQVVASVRVSTSSSRGEMTSVLQLRAACVKPAAGDMMSRSMAVGLAMVLCTPTMAWKSCSVLLSHCSSVSICMVVIFPISKCRCSAVRGKSFVDPRLGLELSTDCRAGSPKVSITALTECLWCSGVSMVMVGPVAKLKKFGRQALRLGNVGACCSPRVNRAMHF